MFTIICPTDFSDLSHNAISYAKNIAKAIGAKIHIFHLIHPSYVTTDSSGLLLLTDDLQEQIKLSDKKLSELKDELLAEVIEVTTSSEYGFWETILEGLEQNYKPNLFVTGTHGATSAFAARLFGQNSLEFVKKLSCPVLVVPAAFTFKGFKKIVYATDYQFNDIDFVKYVIMLAKKQNSEIQFIHVNTYTANNYEEGYMEWLRDLVEKETHYGTLDFKVIDGTTVEETLENYSEVINADMLCVSARNKNLIQELFTHNHTTKLVADAKLPLLIFHLKEDFRM